MTSVDDIITGLREKAWRNYRPYSVEVCTLDDAEAAVHATVREIVAFVEAEARAIPLGDRSEDSYNVAIKLVREVARRFGGTE